MFRHFFGLAACVLCCAQAAGQTGTGGIRGTILDASTQKPLPVAWVVANRDGAPPFSRNTKSGGDGAFEMRGLTPGNYSICVQAEGDRYLDSCHWRGQSAAVTVAKDAITSGVAVRLAAASVVNIEVRDPQKLLGQAIAGGRKARPQRRCLVGERTLLSRPPFRHAGFRRRHEPKLPAGRAARYIANPAYLQPRFAPGRFDRRGSSNRRQAGSLPKLHRGPQPEELHIYSVGRAALKVL